MNQPGRMTGRTRPADVTGRDRTNSPKTEKQVRFQTGRQNPGLETGRRGIPSKGIPVRSPESVRRSLPSSIPEKAALESPSRGRPPARLQPRPAGRARVHVEVLDDVADVLAGTSAALPADGVIVVGAEAVTIADRAETRAKLMASGRLKEDASHFLAHLAPRGWIWVIVVEAARTRLFLHTYTRPVPAMESA